MSAAAAGTERLAILGGPKAVSTPPPHFRWPIIEKDDEAAVVDQLRSGELSYHRNAGVITKLERAFAELHDVPYALSTHSGTGALHAAYFAMDLPPGSEVIAPTYTHLSTVFPMLHVGLVPVLCDVDPSTGNIDPGQIEQLITPRTRAIVVTHEYGHICDMPTILTIARRHGLLVLEDCSHAHGARLEGRLAGTFGDIACFSLQAHKTIPAGEGGILITKIATLFERAALLGHFRQRRSSTTERTAATVATGFGFKNRLHPLAAALALSQLGKLDRTLKSRRSNLEYFSEQLSDVPGVRPLPAKAGVDRGGYFRFLVKYSADELGGLPLDTYIQALAYEGVSEATAGSLAKPLHLTDFFANHHSELWSFVHRLGEAGVYRQYHRGAFPHAEHFSETTIQFPAFTESSKPIIDEYCAAMRKVADGARELLATGPIRT